MSNTDQLWLVFYLTPVLILAVAYVAFRLNERSLNKKYPPRHPAE